MVTGVAKRPVGAHYGLRDWLSQRVTAIVITAYTALLLLILLWHGGIDYPFWQSLFARGWFRVASFLFVIALLIHAWVGVRNILMDYVKPVWVRLALQIVVICALLVYAGWTVQVLWGEPVIRAAQALQGRPS